MWIWQQPDWPRGRLEVMPLMGQLAATQAVMSPLVAQGQNLYPRQRLRLEATLLSEEMEASAQLSGVVLGRAALRDALYQALGLESGHRESPRGPAPGVDVFVDVTLEVVRIGVWGLSCRVVVVSHSVHGARRATKRSAVVTVSSACAIAPRRRTPMRWTGSWMSSGSVWRRKNRMWITQGC